ncbi:MAG TPA: superoxide dismutase, partial [Candidatus Nanoarchaeia archaeon]|nr:superoxide dismutase [Candidatus Nanoarchaeia archaeon]
MAHTLPPLPYTYNALEPFIDEATMKLHHDKHHQAYVDKLNAAVKGTQFENMPVDELVRQLSTMPDSIKTAVRNHGGGHVNHTFFWNILAKGTKISKHCEDAIKKQFGSFDSFKEKFNAAATGVFGSGWAWLVAANEKLEIINTPNQDSPL